jgi:hypothetical protein
MTGEMADSTNEPTHSFWRNRTVALAAVVLMAQSLAVSHYHPREAVSRFAASVTTTYDDGLCGLCLFQQHSPSMSGAALFLVAPTLIERIALYAAQSWPLYSFSSYLSGRSPPASA